MNVTITSSKEKLADKSLGTLKPGEVFHFAYIHFGEAYKENAFYMVATSPENKRVTIVNVYTGELLVRDKEHRVIKRECTISVSND